MNKAELEERTKQFALRVIMFVAALPRNNVNNVVGHQLLKSSTSMGANYREANRAESRRDFIHKVGLVEKEAAETQYWLELSQEARIGNDQECQRLLQESGELLAIFTSIGRTSKRYIVLHSNVAIHIRNPMVPKISKFAIRNPKFKQ
jgi:four helix bundle protein